MPVDLIGLIREQVLPEFGVEPDAAITPLPGGLINQTFLVNEESRRSVLQRVNPIFPVSIHENIQAVTAALARQGLVTPRLIATNQGRDCLLLPPGGAGEAPAVWRLMTHIEGTPFDVIMGTAQARAAGELVARFHAALEGLTHAFVGLRLGVHDTPRHLETLRRSAASHQDHRLFAAVAPLAEQILGAAAALRPLPDLPPRICHGDLKFNNLLFAGPLPPARDHAICLIDLDTVGPMPLAFEMGDAWRSWCNRNGEDQPEADLDLGAFEASLDGYAAGLGRALGAEERLALLRGPEWISLELAARFAADALIERYFGWDPARFAGRGEHNLVRARGQLSLHQALLNSRPLRARLLGSPLPPGS